MTSRFEPRLRIWLTTTSRAPDPIDTTRITAATPMTMPSVVKAVRKGFARSAWTPSRSASR